MRTIEKLMTRAKKYQKDGGGRSMAFICRNYNGGKDWYARITRLIKGKTSFLEEYFTTQEEAVEWAEAQTKEGDALIIDNI